MLDDKNFVWCFSLSINPNYSYVMLTQLSGTRWYGGKCKKGISWFESHGGIYFLSEIGKMEIIKSNIRKRSQERIYEEHDFYPRLRTLD